MKISPQNYLLKNIIFFSNSLVQRAIVHKTIYYLVG